MSPDPTVRPSLVRNGFTPQQCEEILRDILEGSLEGVDRVEGAQARAGDETAGDGAVVDAARDSLTNSSPRNSHKVGRQRVQRGAKDGKGT